MSSAVKARRSASLILLLLFLSACGGDTSKAWQYPGKDPADSYSLHSDWSPGGVGETLFSTEIPALSDDEVMLLRGDMRGGAKAELVVISPHWRRLYSSSGQLLLSTDSSTPRADGFLFDFDSDGKLDLVLGSRQTAVPDVIIENGRGNRLFRYAFADPDRGYLGITAEFTDGDHIILRTDPTWPSNARGIAALSPASGKLAWEYFVPSSTGAIRLYSNPKGYLLSNGTEHNGEFNRLGKEGHIAPGFDGSLHVVLVAPDGSTILLKELRGEEAGLDGTADLYPDSDRGRVVVIHRRNEEREPRGHDSVLTVTLPDGIVGAEREFLGSTIADVRVLPEGSSLGALAISVRTTDTESVVLLQPDLAAEPRVAIVGGRVSLGPVILGPEGDDHLLASVDETLLAISGDSVHEVGQPGFFASLIAATDGPDLLVYGVGHTLTGLRLPGE